MKMQSQAASHALEAMKKQGAQAAQATAAIGRKHELNFQHGELSLLRTTTDYSLGLTAIRDQRRAQLGLNQLHGSAIDAAAAELRALGEAGAPDPAFAIAPGAPAKSFESGPLEPDLTAMRDRMTEFLAEAKRRHPALILEEGFLAHNRGESVFANSNGVHWSATQGSYSFTVVFSAKAGGKMSSFNYTMGSMADLREPLIERFGLADLLRESVGQLDSRAAPGKFTGDILLTPHCLRELLDAWLGYLGDAPMIAGTSVLKGKLGDRVASPLLTLVADPRSKELPVPEFVDPDGFEAAPMTLLERGVLRSYLLSLYGANKTGLARAVNSGSRYVLSPGEAPRASLLGSMKKGIVLTRFSGGRPAPNGDFSGVAKNSYYVENGEVRHALTETMVSGNLLRLFESVSGVSRETLHFGSRRLPWLLGSGVTISGAP